MRKEKYLIQFRNLISQLMTLSENDWNILIKDIEYKEYKKGTILTNFHEVEDNLFILFSGYIRLFHSANGTEYTISYHSPISVVNNTESFITREPSKLCITATTDIHVFKLSHYNIYKSYNNNHISERMGRKLIEIGLINRIRREVQIQSKPAKEKYLSLLKEHPNLIKNISQKEIAAYISITPESLSRIKKQIGKNNN